MSDEREAKPRKRKLKISSESIKVRIEGNTLQAAREAKDKGRYKDRYENEFMGYLIELGLQRYEATCLPIERGEDLKNKGGE